MTGLWIWVAFAFGACVGSFLNVVIYRLPRDKSLARPGSACPNCDKAIVFYDNIPLISWLALAGKCRNCKTPISFRYFVIELLTAVIFAGLFLLYFHFGIRSGLVQITGGGWLVYLLHLILLCGLLAMSAVDLELWIVPLSICWFVTIAGLVFSSVGGYLLEVKNISQYFLLPWASAKTGALAAGALVGLIISIILLDKGIIKRSYGSEDEGDEDDVIHRIEAAKEILFLLPVAVCAAITFYILPTRSWWIDILQKPAVAGFLGSFCGYIIGCGIVWMTRILGTLGFGKEAMGLGDVHLMGAAGAVIGPVGVVVAFFVAPFFGLGWAVFQMFFKKTRQIPYVPFLSLGILTVIIFHDRIMDWWTFVFFGAKVLKEWKIQFCQGG